ncbi:MAG TPA: cupin domain-containing protein [Propionibacteriaceae bacterium]|jgi:transcriptional regulator with XRE-family HTH domain|nr:cupin domain-containing protein [Propionibacteriaceae bacterium]
MDDPKVPPIGSRIRAERARREVTIRALARVVGVSPSLISQIETGESRPTVSTLYRIISTLGLSLEDLFDAGDVDQTPDSPGAVDATGLRYPTDRARGVDPRMSPNERELLILESGVTWERLGQVPHHHVEFLLVTYQPGSTSSPDGRLMRHSGTEYAYLISGELELSLGFDKYVLAPGDSICFESIRPHAYGNHGDVPAVGVWFVVEPN